MAVCDSFFYTNPGGRDHNEDAVGEKVFSSGHLFLLADGLGGHQRGELASACVVDAMKNAPGPEEGQELSQWMAQQVQRANQQLLALRESIHCGMKSTLDRLVSVTNDHSVAFAKFKSGEITRRQIGKDEDQSSLLRALGNPERSHPDLGNSQEALQQGDGFLLCSDGVWEYLYDGEVLTDFLKTETAQEWGELLLLRVMERIEPGNDNLSLITVRLV